MSRKFNYQEADQFLRPLGLGFTMNVIMVSCGKPKTKVKNLIKLVKDGHEVRHAQFQTYTIVVDNKAYDLSWLDKPSF